MVLDRIRDAGQLYHSGSVVKCLSVLPGVGRTTFVSSASARRLRRRRFRRDDYGDASLCPYGRVAVLTDYLSIHSYCTK